VIKYELAKCRRSQKVNESLDLMAKTMGIWEFIKAGGGESSRETFSKEDKDFLRTICPQHLALNPYALSYLKPLSRTLVSSSLSSHQDGVTSSSSTLSSEYSYNPPLSLSLYILFIHITYHHNLFKKIISTVQRERERERERDCSWSQFQ